MDNIPSIKKSILFTVIFFFLLQIVICNLTIFIYYLKYLYLLFFYPFVIIYHIFLLLFLYYRKKDFMLEGSSDILPKVNIANKITIARLSSIPSVLFLLILAKENPIGLVVFPLLGLIFLTDFLDGITARCLKQKTKIGKDLDSISDYIILITVSFTLFWYELIPLWLLLLILVRLLIIVPGIIVILITHGKIQLKATWAGKVSIFVIMTFYLTKLLEYLNIPLFSNLIFIRIVEYITAVIVFLSLIEKLIYFFKNYCVKKAGE